MMNDEEIKREAREKLEASKAENQRKIDQVAARMKMFQERKRRFQK